MTVGRPHHSNETMATELDIFVNKREPDTEVLTYPFEAPPELIEKAAAGSRLAHKWLPGVNINKLSTGNDIQTICVRDLARLAPGEWLNDALINFALSW